ncbi:bifunctional (p)ppGpp synthetase/guanosine-3',5'-bis(diphosphate) 3'-pyrophosphohydrolase [Dehalococcoidia bacterium]|nr:bifunctional (p)ppGpp synthetase/guanosine-3',5'-bis(diphosphate) 3'-pyrophosphohydrolase [Dehalococcoidia bacterium]
MSSPNTLLTLAQEYLSDDRVSTVNRAYLFAEKAHSGQTRKSGEPFIEHPVQTAICLAEFRMDSDTLTAALLHDVLEDCNVPMETIVQEFGDGVAQLVDGVTKLTRTELLSEKRTHSPIPDATSNLAQAASLRKMLMSMAEDIRVVLIKLADRLHNMRTLEYLPRARRTAIARETLDIYAPLAHRLGIWEMKWPLEDLAFQHLDPEAYQSISKLLRGKRGEREDYVQRVCTILQNELSKAGIKAAVTGRPKHIYSIYKKMKVYAAENKEIGEIYDLFALRVIANEVTDCYAALGTVHAKWHPLPGQFDDYIANPKDNLYQSLHTTILCEDASPVEIQIRTREMHQLSEYGVAAHWLYKEGLETPSRFEEKMTWLRQLLEWQKDVSGAQEFVDAFKTDVFKNQVFVYTPKGDLKELPTEATPLDFAYRIHTDVGHRCIGAKVNGKLVSLQYQLQNGDSVEVITSKTVRGPSLDWLNSNLGVVKTASAKEKIRQWFNRQTRKANQQRGKEIFLKQVKRLNTSLKDIEVARLLDFTTVGSFFESLGNGSVTTSMIVSRLSSEKVKPEEKEYEAPSLISGPASGIEVLGVGDLLTTLARCCNPINGDYIVGYITRNRGVTVHLKTCPNIKAEQETERLIGVKWGRSQTLYSVRLRIEAWDRVGLLSDITSLVSDEKVNIASCLSEEHDDLSIISLTVYTDGIDQLSRLCAKLEGVDAVMRVSRARS